MLGSKNGVKWFLSLFRDLGAVLGFVSFLNLFAVSPLLERAEVLEAAEGEGDHLYEGF